MPKQESESQKKAIRNAREAAKRLDSGSTSRPAQTVQTWARNMKQYIQGQR